MTGEYQPAFKKKFKSSTQYVGNDMKMRRYLQRVYGTSYHEFGETLYVDGSGTPQYADESHTHEVVSRYVGVAGGIDNGSTIGHLQIQGRAEVNDERFGLLTFYDYVSPTYNALAEIEGAFYTGTGGRLKLKTLVASGALVTTFASVNGTNNYSYVPTIIQFSSGTNGGMLVLDQTGAGDAAVEFRIGGTNVGGIGIDNSDSDKIKITRASASPFALPTNAAIVINSTDYVGFSHNSPTALVDIAAPDTNRSPLRLRSGAPTSSPNEGDIYGDGTDLFYRTAAGAWVDLTQVFPPSGVSGAIQFTDGTNFASDASSLFFDDSSNFFQMGSTSAASANIILKATGAAIFNEQGSDVDFRIEGDTDQNLVFVDASTDRVGHGTASPAAKVDSLATTEQLRLSYNASNYASFTVSSGGDLTIAPSGSDTIITGELGIGVTPSYPLHVTGQARVTTELSVGSSSPSSLITITGVKSLDMTAAQVGRGFHHTFQDQSTTTNTHYVLGCSSQVDLYYGSGISNTGYARGIDGSTWHRGDGSLTNAYGLFFSVGTYNSGSDSLGTITNSYGCYIQTIKTTSSTITNNYGVYIASGVGTNNHGLYIAAQTAGTTLNYAIYSAGGTSYHNGSMGFGTTTVSAKVHSLATTEQLRLGYDAGNYCSFTVSSGGDLTIAPSGGDFTFTGNSTLEGAVVINEAGADKDVRIEGDTDTNLLFTDASADKVGVGNNAPGEKLEVTGNIKLTRLKPSGGTSIQTTDVALSAGWGASAAVTAVSGNDSRGTITVTTNAADTPTANPTVTLTFKDGTWTSTPFAVACMNGGSTGPAAAVTTAPTATTLVLKYIGTPTATSALTYIFAYVAVG